MTRAETTKFLGDLRIVRFKDRTYWAREVSIDYGISYRKYDHTEEIFKKYVAIV